MSNPMLLALLAATAVFFGACGFLLGRRRNGVLQPNAQAAPRGPADARRSQETPAAAREAAGAREARGTASAPRPVPPPETADVQIEFDSLERQVRRSRESGLPLTLVHLSADQLDAIREHHGREAVDRVLRGIARAVRSQLRPGDLCVRDGTDTFVVVVPGVGAERAPAVTARIEGAVRQHKFAVARGLSIRVSICQGAASLPEDGTSYDALLAAAQSRRQQVAEVRAGRPATVGSLLRYAGRPDVTFN
ncbi:MAG TPA: GGDEF domain-containing protein [Candidatus Polarisedimenticolia bacterium]|jgi:diguanylate cyclase (GGDEF)-like protein|nr:GGDEF domain-containing protein [Candidatus Polarisedimenticolia bacterium]